MLLSVLAMVVSLAALVAIAATRHGGVLAAYAHMATAAFTGVGLALLAIRENRTLQATGANTLQIAASTARAMGLVWGWGALALGLTYGTGILVWKEWWHFLLALALASGLCLLFSATLRKDARQAPRLSPPPGGEGLGVGGTTTSATWDTPPPRPSPTRGEGGSKGQGDDVMLKLGTYLAVAQLVGMVAAMLGLLIDGKMTRFLVPRHTDWAANNIFFFGALAIALISAHALWSKKGA